MKLRIQKTFSAPLHLTGYEGHFEAAEALLEAGASIFAENKFNDTVLHIAIRHGQVSFVKSLIEYLSENPMVLERERGSRKFLFDVENTQEKLTPF